MLSTHRQKRNRRRRLVSPRVSQCTTSSFTRRRRLRHSRRRNMSLLLNAVLRCNALRKPRPMNAAVLLQGRLPRARRSHSQSVSRRSSLPWSFHQRSRLRRSVSSTRALDHGTAETSALTLRLVSAMVAMLAMIFLPTLPRRRASPRQKSVSTTIPSGVATRRFRTTNVSLTVLRRVNRSLLVVQLLPRPSTRRSLARRTPGSR
mmetsp:Transcript_22410/g.43971  ORF Transcript_22410/g.43971 Transcript_22410/m.43971 type:complete len:204 (+) Transcript_22410:3051-3662(+)